jgi:hypothetical protein
MEHTVLVRVVEGQGNLAQKPNRFGERDPLFGAAQVT